MKTNLRDKSILVTGHTGFKGAWLSEWLLRVGARVSGLALPPEEDTALYNLLALHDRLHHYESDIRDAAAVVEIVKRCVPEVVFHLAAQALVRRGYREPLATWETNVIGTINLLEALKLLRRPVTVVVVTTDKVYENREWEFPYRESDRLGGFDPYSASKAACEIAVASWRASFSKESGVSVVTARAGNVLGAGDYSEDRIVPDCFRAWSRGESVLLRNPNSTRPWQHVLEPLSGYIALAEMVRANKFSLDSCNFGPGLAGNRSVATLVSAFAALAPNRDYTIGPTGSFHEAGALSLAIDRARHKLGWSPRLSFLETVSWTNSGYVVEQSKLPELVRGQISDFEARRPEIDS